MTKEMKAYCMTEGCRRQYMAEHFGLQIEPVSLKHMCCDNCEAQCICSECSLSPPAYPSSGTDETDDSAVVHIIETALQQYFAAVNSDLQGDHAVEASSITALTPELAAQIARNSAHLCGEDVLKVAFPYLDTGTVQTISQIIKDIQKLSL